MRKIIDFLEEHWILVSILLLGFVTKIAFIAQMDNTVLVFGDALEYYDTAMSILESRPWPIPEYSNAFRAPVYPYFVSFIYLFAPENHLLVKLIQCTLFTISVFSLYKIGQKLFSLEVALISTAIYSLHPYYLIFTAHVQSEAIFLVVTLPAIYLLLTAFDTHRYKTQIFFTGILTGYGILTRPTFIIFIPIAVLWLMLKQVDKKRFLTCSFVFAGACVATLSPWILRNYIRHNEFIYCNDAGGYFLWLGSRPEQYEILTEKDPKRFKFLYFDGAMAIPVKKQLKLFRQSVDFDGLSPKERERMWYRAAFSHIRKNKSQVTKIYLLKLRDYVRPWLHPLAYSKTHVVLTKLINTPIFILGFIGVFFAVRSEVTRKDTLLFIAYFSASALVHAVFLSMSRYRIVFWDPFLYIFAVQGAKQLLMPHLSSESH